MNKVNKILLKVLVVLVVTACQQTEIPIELTTTATPPTTSTETSPPKSVSTALPANELSAYYGEPQPAKIIVNGKTYDSEIGNTMWITEVPPDGSQAAVLEDAFAIITP